MIESKKPEWLFTPSTTFDGGTKAGGLQAVVLSKHTWAMICNALSDKLFNDDFSDCDIDSELAKGVVEVVEQAKLHINNLVPYVRLKNGELVWIFCKDCKIWVASSVRDGQYNTGFGCEQFLSSCTQCGRTIAVSYSDNKPPECVGQFVENKTAFSSYSAWCLRSTWLEYNDHRETKKDRLDWLSAKPTSDVPETSTRMTFHALATANSQREKTREYRSCLTLSERSNVIAARCGLVCAATDAFVHHVRHSPYWDHPPSPQIKAGLRDQLADSLADLLIELDLLATLAEVDLEAKVVERFNVLSRAIQSNYSLPSTDNKIKGG